MIVIGFTGSSTVITSDQERELRKLFAAYDKTGPCTLTHGDCVKGDEIAHDAAMDLHWRILVRPPVDEKKRAFCSGPSVHVTILPAKPYRARNSDIATTCNVLVATPEAREKDLPRSGTWMTVRMARGLRRPVKIIAPGGMMYDDKDIDGQEEAWR